MNTTYMKEYLGYAFRTEQYVRTLESTFNQATNEYNISKNKLENYFKQHNISVEGIENFDINELKNEKITAKRKLKKAVLFLISCVIICLLLTLISVILFATKQEVFINFAIILIIIMEIVLHLAVVASFINLAFRFFKFKKATEAINTATSTNITNIVIRDNSRLGIDEERKRLQILLTRKNHIESVLNEAKENRRKIYSKNILHKDYQNIIAVGHMYGYLCRGICNTIEGHGGIYDTFKNDMQHYETIEKLNILIDQNTEIIRNQIELHRAIVKGNEMSTKMYNEFKDFSETQRKNATIDQIQRQQTNESLSYIQWSMTH